MNMSMSMNMIVVIIELHVFVYYVLLRSLLLLTVIIEPRRRFAPRLRGAAFPLKARCSLP